MHVVVLRRSCRAGHENEGLARTGSLASRTPPLAAFRSDRPPGPLPRHRPQTGSCGYTHDDTGIKIYYFLLQIACILDQLIDKGSLLRHCFTKGFGSAKNFAWRLLEATRNARLTPDDYHVLLDTRIQIRFRPP